MEFCNIYYSFNTERFTLGKEKEGEVESIFLTNLYNNKGLCMFRYDLDLEPYNNFVLKKETEEEKKNVKKILQDYFNEKESKDNFFAKLLQNECGQRILLYIFLQNYSKLKMKELDNHSLYDFGITIDFHFKFHRTNATADTEDLELLHEDILWKNMNDTEKAKKFSEYLKKIDLNNGELIIIDPYFFNSDKDSYCNLLSSILRNSNASSIIVITNTSSGHYKSTCLNKIQKKINININVKDDKEYHDRFWIANRKKGFLTGTSLNGIGKRIALIDELDDSDTNDIIADLLNRNLIK